MNFKTILLASISIAMVLSITVSFAYAHPHSGQIQIASHSHQPQTEITSINGIIGLEKTTLTFHTPENNKLPWGFVEGNIKNHVEGYPVIIQIYKNNDAVHFAQTNVESDGSYEYKFRVLNSDNGTTTKLFDGDYSVKIFKVVYLNQEPVV